MSSSSSSCRAGSTDIPDPPSPLLPIVQYVNKINVIHKRFNFLRLCQFPRGWVVESWRFSQPGFDPSFGNLACLATLKSCDSTKQSVCGWLYIGIIQQIKWHFFKIKFYFQNFFHKSWHCILWNWFIAKIIWIPQKYLFWGDSKWWINPCAPGLNRSLKSNFASLDLQTMWNL